MPGIGMMYPQVYQEAIKDIENGNYGAQWQQLINSEEYVAVNAERYIYLQQLQTLEAGAKFISV